MNPQRIILVRHGESEGNVDPQVYAQTPDYALDLTEQGREQSLRAGREISSIIGTTRAVAYVSPWKRTRLTYELIAGTLKDRIVQKIEDPLIREQDWGHFSSVAELTKINREREAYGQFYYRVPNGESGADVYYRMSCFIEGLQRDFDRQDFPENALIVTHGLALRIFLCRFFSYSVEYFETLDNPFNAEVVVIERNRNGIYGLKTPLRHQRYADRFRMAS